MVKSGWIPPRSPFGLLQEDVFPNEWRILTVAQFLNCTTRKQLDKVFPTFVNRWPNPGALLSCDKDDLIDVITPLGFGNRRANSLLKMTHDYVHNDWVHASELYGIGEYGARSWEIFCLGYLGDDPPQDGALVKYWKWMKERETRHDC